MRRPSLEGALDQMRRAARDGFRQAIDDLALGLFWGGLTFGVLLAIRAWTL